MTQPTIETLDVRVEKLEDDVRSLFSKVNEAVVAQAAVNEKLNSLLVTLGEVKQAVTALQQMPARRLDMLLRAAAAALATGICGYLFAKFR